ncbi:hypothetical protein ZIOFF_055259 [Zingiber officinale]|uniref:Uncharacterized protein n=1 Tax=Zingiber officinale TaxID=94328 RepID=A0A8J5KS54_ZINOF|nr:hypothetical protein ZIOFF_055259 [Zingiber officinale]
MQEQLSSRVLTADSSTAKQLIAFRVRQAVPHLLAFELPEVQYFMITYLLWPVESLAATCHFPWALINRQTYEKWDGRTILPLQYNQILPIPKPFAAPPLANDRKTLAFRRSSSREHARAFPSRCDLAAVLRNDPPSRAHEAQAFTVGQPSLSNLSMSGFNPIAAAGTPIVPPIHSFPSHGHPTEAGYMMHKLDLKEELLPDTFLPLPNSMCVLLGVSCGANITDFVARKAIEAGKLIERVKVVAQVLMYPFFAGTVLTHSELKLAG